MLIHGVLHLLGYDHESDRTRPRKWKRWRPAHWQILGWPCPYSAEPARAAAGAAQ
jgi:hypothetical protein